MHRAAQHDSPQLVVGGSSSSSHSNGHSRAPHFVLTLACAGAVARAASRPRSKRRQRMPSRSASESSFQECGTSFFTTDVCQSPRVVCKQPGVQSVLEVGSSESENGACEESDELADVSEPARSAPELQTVNVDTFDVDTCSESEVEASDEDEDEVESGEDGSNELPQMRMDGAHKIGGLQRKGCGKLWSNAEFPEGIRGAANWDLLNLSKAQDWRCPCPDRSCLSRERFPKVDELYDYRKTFQTASRKKGLRDSFRIKVLEPSYSKQLGAFGRSVRIGGWSDNCVVAAGLAAGLSFATFANARADVTKERPYHAGRVAQRDKLKSAKRIHLEQYIFDLRKTMEGDKGGQGARDRWYTGKRAGVSWHVHTTH